VPGRALDLVPERGRISELEGRVVSGGRSFWQSTGGELAAGLAERYERLDGARNDLRRRADELAEAARDVDPEAAAAALSGIRSDLRTLWERLASNESEEGDNPRR
jgi:hypothetical protein